MRVLEEIYRGMSGLSWGDVLRFGYQHGVVAKLVRQMCRF